MLRLSKGFSDGRPNVADARRSRAKARGGLEQFELSTQLVTEAALLFHVWRLDVTRDQDHRRRVGPCLGNRGQGVGSTGPSGRDRHAWPTGGARVTIGGKTSPLLVTDDHVLDFGCVTQRVVQGKIVHAWHAKHDVNTVRLQRRDHCLSACHVAHE